MRVPWRSFRLRIALLSTALSTLVLVAFGAYMLLVVDRLSRERTDAFLREQARRMLVPVPAPDGPAHFARAEQGLAALGGPEDASPALLRVWDEWGGEIYRSPGWPDALDVLLPPPGPPRHRRAGMRQAGPNHFPEGPPPGAGAGAGPGRGLGFGRGQGQGMRGGPPPGPHAILHPIEEHTLFTWEGQGGPWRVGVVSSPRATLALALRAGAFGVEQRQTQRALLLALPIMLLLVGASGFLLAQRALRPVEALAHRAEQITAQALGQRMPPTGGAEEFQRLTDVFNGMLERLERSFAQATRFSADAAHELKTPIAVLQGELERGVQETAPGSPEQVRCERLAEQVQRLKSITRKLLLLATADAGRLVLAKKPLDLSAALADMVDDLEVLATGITVESRIQPGVTVMADADLLRQAMQNLLNNAVKYNKPGGRIAVTVRKAPGQVEMTVFNTGPGIAPEDRERIFERFYRADKARGHTGGHAGLGLSLAREIARAHGGMLVLGEGGPGGTTFTLRLPAP